MSFLNALLERVNAVTPEEIAAAEVTDSPEEGEEVIGELTGAERSIYAVLNGVTGKIKTLSEEHGKTHKALEKKIFVTNKDKENQSKLCAEFHEKLSELEEERDIIKRIFWKSVQDRLQETGKDVSNIGVRKDWKVVMLRSKGLEMFSVPGLGMVGIGIEIKRRDGKE